jgi:hypoxanthine-DNA glycosylase
MTRATGFAALARPSARTLILGSLPGQASLAAGQYYAHPRNGFWPILGGLFGFDPAAPYPARVAALTDAGLAVWDVCHQAVRPGSLDGAIEPGSVVPNDFASFFAAHAELRRIAFNGATAIKLYRRLVLPGLPAAWAGFELLALPSTSPAHAAMPSAEKRRRWAVLRASD